MKHIVTITDKDITGADKLSSAEPRIAVDAVLFDADGNIAVQYVGKYDLHTLPGGGVDPGEDLQVALKREIWEETGCDCEIIGELGYINENRSEHDFTQERYYYLARVVGEKGELHLTDEEISEDTTVVWRTMEQALKIISEKQHDYYPCRFVRKRNIAALTEAIIWSQTHDIPGYDAFIKIEPINKGWSDDKKYCVETADGRRMLLRVSDIDEYERKKAEYGMMERVHNHGVFTSCPVEFALCNNGKSVYQLSGWLDGEDLHRVLPSMPETEQYVVGFKAGEILHKIHELPAPDNAEPWDEWFSHKLQGRIDFYSSSSAKSDNGDILVRYLQENKHIINDRPQTFNHGDYNIENFILSPDGQIGVIDFNYYNKDHGDPWWEFAIIAWELKPSEHFYTGLINGYFDDAPPKHFFSLLSYYMSYVALGASCDPPDGKDGVPDDANEYIKNVLEWFDNMNNPVPNWYLKKRRAAK